MKANEKLTQLYQLLVNLEDTALLHLELPWNALPDCTDRKGNPYPSQWASDLFKEARLAVTENHDEEMLKEPRS